MLKEILDDPIVKKTILTIAILVSIMMVVISATMAVKFLVASKIFIGVLRILTCLFWMFMGGATSHIIYRDFIRKKKDV